MFRFGFASNTVLHFLQFTLQTLRYKGEMMRINECSIGISRLKWNVIKSYEGLLGDTTKFPDDEAVGQVKSLSPSPFRP